MLAVMRPGHGEKFGFSTTEFTVLQRDTPKTTLQSIWLVDVNVIPERPETPNFDNEERGDLEKVCYYALHILCAALRGHWLQIAGHAPSLRDDVVDAFKQDTEYYLGERDTFPLLRTLQI